MDNQAYINAFVELHSVLSRQGPGDEAFTVNLLHELRTDLPSSPAIIDLGCGTGAASFLLAEHLKGKVQAVDASEAFIDSLSQQVASCGLSDVIHPSVDNFSALAEVDYPTDHYDLLWSECSAYHLGFRKALKTWRPLVKKGGIAIISELSWLTSTPSTEAQAFWQAAYPLMATESDNIEMAKRYGFELIFAKRLPEKAWWDNYYNPLLKRMQQLRMNIGMNASEALYDVLDNTDAEIALFDRHSSEYGYTFYILKAV